MPRMVQESPYNTPNVFNAVIDGRPAYATSDLLQVHPTKPHLFRVFGRVDDQLMLSTGEKTNPAPLGKNDSPDTLPSVGGR